MDREMITEDLIRQVEQYHADTEELWEGKLEYDHKPERGVASNIYRIGVVGVTPKAGATFIVWQLDRRMKKEWAQNSQRGEYCRPFKIVDIGEDQSVRIEQMDFLIAVVDGSQVEKDQQKTADRKIAAIIDRLRHLGIPFQLVVNRGNAKDPMGEEDRFLEGHQPIYFPVMVLDPVEQLMMRFSVTI